MNGFKVEAALYFKAEELVNSLIQSFDSSVNNAIQDVNDNIPSGYEYTADLKSIFSALANDKTELNDLANRIKTTTASLEAINSSFSYKSSKLSLDGETENTQKWYQDIGNAYKETGAAWGQGIKAFFKGEGYGDLLSALGQTGATVFVIDSSVASGILKLVEYLGDGVTFAAGSIGAGIGWVSDQFTGNNLASETMDYTLNWIRRDLVGEINDSFYQNTSFGALINEYSNLKYDGKGATTIKKVGEGVSKAVAATAATVATGGAAAPLIIGALYGVGSGVEKYTQNVDIESGETYNYLQVAGKALASGMAGAAEWYGYGQIGSGLISASSAFSMAASGTGVTASSVLKGLASSLKNIKGIDLKTFTKSFSKNFFLVDNLLYTSATVTDHVVDWAFGDETTEELLKSGGAELALVLGLNAIGSGIGAAAEGIMNSNSRMVLGDAIAAEIFKDSKPGRYGVDQGVFNDFTIYRIMNNDWNSGDFFQYLVKRSSEMGIPFTPKDLNEINNVLSGEIFSVEHAELITDYLTWKNYSIDEVKRIFNRSFALEKADCYDQIVPKYMKMGLTEEEVVDFLKRIDKKGACSYAAPANGIADAFKDKPELFKKLWGFDLYREVDGELVVNSEELLADLYVFANNRSIVPEAKLFDIVDGKLTVLSDDVNNQVYLSTKTTFRSDILDKYLKSKSSQLSYSAKRYEYRLKRKNDKDYSSFLQTPSGLRKTFNEYLEAGNQVQIGVYKSGEYPFRFNNGDDVYVTSNNWNEGQGHAVFVTGIIDKNIIVSSWGKKMEMPLIDFCGNDFNIIRIDINIPDGL